VNKKGISISLGVMCIILSFMIVVQINTVSKSISLIDPTFAENDLRNEVLKWKERYDNSYKSLEKAEKELEKERTKATQNTTNSETKEEELKIGNIILGLTDVNGKGVTITLKDNQSVTADTIGMTDDIRNYVVHDIDILSVVNELKNAGAEAISINEQRIIPTSSITCAGNVAQINGEKVGAPFVIKAIGDVDGLYDALSRPGGYIEALNRDGIITTIKKSNSIFINKYNGIINYKYSKEL